LEKSSTHSLTSTPPYRQAARSLSAAHTKFVIPNSQERGEFANIGWNNKYHFTKPDFDACAFFLGKFLANVRERKIPWESIQKFMEQVKKMKLYCAIVGKNRSSDVNQVVYGAHMTDGYDSRVIVTYLQEFCGAFIFNSKFYFYQDDNTSYGLPSIQNLFGILG
jgi:hypothetical protein